MQRFYVTTYRFREHLDENNLREVTKRFAEIGNAPGVIAHYYRSDGQGGYVIANDTADAASQLQSILHYVPWIEFDTHPAVSIEEAFPVIQSVYG